jgi:hypothetical protein
MFCPKCRTEYRKGFTACSDCDIPLVDELLPINLEQLKELDQRQAARKSRNRFITSLIFAPLFAPLMMFLILALHAEWVERFSPIKSTGWLSSFGIIMIFGALVSYVFTILLGLPLYFIFKRLGRINYLFLSIGGAAIASVPWILMGLSEGIKKIQENYSVILVLAACGFAVGNAFYVINYWRNSNLNAREGR